MSWSAEHVARPCSLKCRNICKENHVINAVHFPGVGTMKQWSHKNNSHKKGSIPCDLNKWYSSRMMFIDIKAIWVGSKNWWDIKRCYYEIGKTEYTPEFIIKDTLKKSVQNSGFKRLTLGAPCAWTQPVRLGRENCYALTAFKSLVSKEGRHGKQLSKKYRPNASLAT